MRQLRNEGGKVIDRVEAGESFTVTRDGRPVAELRPIEKRWPTTAEVIAEMRRLGLRAIDPDELRNDIDSVLDPSLDRALDHRG